MADDLKTRWVKALRSGRYRQGRHYLQQEQEGRKKNCCLGVLCRVARVGDEWDAHTLLSEFTEGIALMERVGLSNADERQLVTRNDGGESFREIADYIEANL